MGKSLNCSVPVSSCRAWDSNMITWKSLLITNGFWFYDDFQITQQLYFYEVEIELTRESVVFLFSAIRKAPELMNYKQTNNLHDGYGKLMRRLSRVRSLPASSLCFPRKVRSQKPQGSEEGKPPPTTVHRTGQKGRICFSLSHLFKEEAVSTLLDFHFLIHFPVIDIMTQLPASKWHQCHQFKNTKVI